jgi:hypothetical protein
MIIVRKCEDTKKAFVGFCVLLSDCHDCENERFALRELFSNDGFELLQ